MMGSKKDKEAKDLVLSADPPPVKKRASKVLKPVDVCDIIKACYNVNVKRLSYDGLVIEFSHSPVNEPEKQPSPVSVQDAIPLKAPIVDDEVNVESFVNETEQLDLDDPVSYEQYALGDEEVHLGKPGEE